MSAPAQKQKQSEQSQSSQSDQSSGLRVTGVVPWKVILLFCAAGGVGYTGKTALDKVTIMQSAEAAPQRGGTEMEQAVPPPSRREFEHLAHRVDDLKDNFARLDERMKAMKETADHFEDTANNLLEVEGRLANQLAAQPVRHHR